MSDGTIRLIDGEEPEFLDAIVESMEPCTKAWYQGRARLPARPVAVCVDGEMVWTEADRSSPEAALMRYFADLAPPQPAPEPVKVDNCTAFAELLAEWEADPVMAALLDEARREFRQQLAKLPDPNAKPALSGLTKTAPGAKHGPGWCDE